jgi:hypothetical protein
MLKVGKMCSLEGNDDILLVVSAPVSTFYYPVCQLNCFAFFFFLLFENGLLCSLHGHELPSMVWI